MNPASLLLPPSHVVLDACVLMPGILRRLLLRTGSLGLCQPAWSERIGEEWRRNAARIWSIAPERLEAEWLSMQQRFPDACASDIATWESGLRYSDPKDWHVIAAARSVQARHPGASVAVVTWNLRDFNRSELRRMGLQALSPDTLLSRCWQADPATVHTALAGMAADAEALGGTPEPIADALRRERLFLLRQLFWAHTHTTASQDAAAPNLEPATP